MDEHENCLFLLAGESAVSVAAGLRAAAGRIQPGAGRRNHRLIEETTRQSLDSAVTGPIRLGISLACPEELPAKVRPLEAALETGRTRCHDPAGGVHFGRSPLAEKGKTVFLFPGQGSQKPGMLGELCRLFPVVRETFALADQALAGALPRPLSAYVFPPAAETAAGDDEPMRQLTRTRVAQPALGAAGLGLCRLLGALNIVPWAAAGHSAGEYAALCAAGALPAETMFQLLEYRGRCMEEAAGRQPGAMAAVMAGEADTVAALAGIPEIQAANFNAPAQTVISGSRAGLARAGARLKEAGLRMREIPVAGAFHSSFMEPARAIISRRLAETPFQPPVLPVYSNTLADRYPADTGAWPALLGEHLVKPVRFVQEVEKIYGDGGRIFVESGPGNVLTNLVGRILAGREFVAFAPGSPAGAGGLGGLLDCLAGLFVEGVVPGRLPADLYGPEANTPRPVTRA